MTDKTTLLTSRHVCTRCNHKFRDRYNLDRHDRVCGQKDVKIRKPIACPVCAREFRDNRDMNRHHVGCQLRVKAHIEAQKTAHLTTVWQCPYPDCKLRTCTHQALVRHVEQTCTPEKREEYMPKVCEWCSEKFPTLLEWNTHRMGGRRRPLCKSLTTCAMCGVEVRWLDLRSHLLTSENCCTNVYEKLRPVQIDGKTGVLTAALTALYWLGFRVDKMWLLDTPSTVIRNLTWPLYYYLLHNHGALGYIILVDMKERHAQAARLARATGSVVFSSIAQTSRRVYTKIVSNQPQQATHAIWEWPYQMAMLSPRPVYDPLHGLSRYQASMQKCAPGSDPPILTVFSFTGPGFDERFLQFRLPHWKRWLLSSVRYTNYSRTTKNAHTDMPIWYDLFLDMPHDEDEEEKEDNSCPVSRAYRLSHDDIVKKLRALAIPPEWRITPGSDNILLRSGILKRDDIRFTPIENVTVKEGGTDESTSVSDINDEQHERVKSDSDDDENVDNEDKHGVIRKKHLPVSNTTNVEQKKTASAASVLVPRVVKTTVVPTVPIKTRGHTGPSVIGKVDTKSTTAKTTLHWEKKWTLVPVHSMQPSGTTGVTIKNTAVFTINRTDGTRLQSTNGNVCMPARVPSTCLYRFPSYLFVWSLYPYSQYPPPSPKWSLVRAQSMIPLEPNKRVERKMPIAQTATMLGTQHTNVNPRKRPASASPIDPEMLAQFHRLEEYRRYPERQRVIEPRTSQTTLCTPEFIPIGANGLTADIRASMDTVPSGPIYLPTDRIDRSLAALRMLVREPKRKHRRHHTRHRHHRHCCHRHRRHKRSGRRSVSSSSSSSSDFDIQSEESASDSPSLSPSVSPSPLDNPRRY